ncbi:MAG: hypothetical protein WStaBPW_38630 [Shewanella algae]
MGEPDAMKELERRMGEAEKQNALARHSIDLMAENLKLMRQSLDELTKQNTVLALLQHRVERLDRMQYEMQTALKSVQDAQTKTDGAKAGTNWIITHFPKVGQLLLWLLVGMLALSSFWPLGGKGS